ncbi:hypothetical protein HPP92_004809 [Vanilla planifolia]|uniref:Uncharacterized protein n=1 Tax=Vanilla planifolia TaxID=51239 RepID=A0A835VCL8_VANPL|nr:hypothetical protein HPP92_004809 [Vanilla planifolia]
MVAVVGLHPRPGCGCRSYGREGDAERCRGGPGPWGDEQGSWRRNGWGGMGMLKERRLVERRLPETRIQWPERHRSDRRRELRPPLIPKPAGGLDLALQPV